MNSPKVSICIPTYQQVEYLKKTLDSIQIQGFTDYEIIITDDSRNNSVRDLILTYSLSLPIRYYLNEQQLGSPKNWNKTISYANGQYIKLLHHDDWFTSENSLECFVELLDNNPRAVFGFSSTLVYNVTNNTSHIHRASNNQINKLKQNPEILFLGNIIGSPSATIYRNNIKYEYNQNLYWLVDIDFYIRFLGNNRDIAFSNQTLISTCNGAKHQVTQSCINNPQVDLFEHIYLYNNLSNQSKYDLKYLFYMLGLFKKYKINSLLKLQQIVKNNFYQDFFLYYVMIALSKTIINLDKLKIFWIKIFSRKLLLKLKSTIKSLKKTRLNIFDLLTFIAEFNHFRSLNRQLNRDLSINVSDWYPCINDKTSSTNIDSHYIYHTAWASRILAKNKPKYHVDISSYIYFSTIISSFIPVRFYDYRPANLILSDLTSEPVDLLNLPFDNNSIQSLSCMHVVEHIGLGRYGDIIDPEGDLRAIRELKRVLAIDGFLLFVVPIGIPKVMFNAHRIYSYEQIISYFTDFQLEEFALIPDNGEEVGLIYSPEICLVNKQIYGCGCFYFRKTIK